MVLFAELIIASSTITRNHKYIIQAKKSNTTEHRRSVELHRYSSSPQIFHIDEYRNGKVSLGLQPNWSFGVDNI